MSRAIFNNPLVSRRNWYQIDARGMVVGRLAEKIATLLQGKYKPVYNPSVDCGDFVVVTNVDQIQFTGNKWRQKLYRWHTGYPGGLKEVPAFRMHERKPERVLEHAVSGMLPKNRLRKHRMRRLKVYTGDEHLHRAQLANALPVPEHLETEVKEKKEKDQMERWIIGFHDRDNEIELVGRKLVPPQKPKKRQRKKKTWEEVEEQYETLRGAPPGWGIED